MTTESVCALNPNQIELLQSLIRQFKTLGKRFSDSKIPELIERHVKSQPTPVSSVPFSSTQLEQNTLLPPASEEKFIPKDTSTEPQQHPIPDVLTKPSLPPLSWQCFHSLLLFGITKAQMVDSIACSSSDLGCFSKGAFLPLVPTLPAVSFTREVLTKCQLADSKNSILPASNLELQRNMRSSFLKNWLDLKKSISLSEQPSYSYDSFVMDCPNFNQHSRNKIIKRRWDREERRRKDTIERKKKQVTEYQRSLLDHRENFLKFHKFNRTETSKYAKNAKAAVEALEQKRIKDEARAEMKRLQALKENDMEAYASMVEEAKNGRLKFLLAETDNYIATINKLVQEQREGLDFNNNENQVPYDAIDVGDKSSKAVKDYVRSTHRTAEHVIQPKMLKGGDLKEYQMAGLQWLVSLYNNNLNGILADEMGLGKTIQTISLLTYLMEIKHNMGPFLIVVPLSTMSNWANEFNKWAPDIIKVLYKGTPEERKRIYKEEVENMSMNVLITTYEYIMKDKTNLRKIFWQYIIVDEGHRMKNADSKFAQTLGTVYQSKNRILLTGTPLQNNLPELWALLNFLLPKIFSSMETFDQWFNKPFAAFRNQNNGAQDENTEDSNALTQEERLLVIHRLHEVLRPFVLRRVKDQVLDQLPEKVEKVLRCPLSGWQRHMYSSITSRVMNAKDGVGLNNPVMQLRKICNHPYLFLSNYVIDENIVRISGKFELLDRMLPKLQAAGHRVLMFSQMVEAMKCLESYFQFRRFNYLILDGSTAADEREKRMYAFNDPNSPFFIFLLSTRAGGLGLNLATADTVIIFDSDWNPMADAQAQDRAHRIGQKNEVRVFRLTTNAPIEERILARANDKKNLTGLVVEAGTFNSGNTDNEGNKEMMESLLNEYILNGSHVNADNKDLLDDSEIPDDDQINEMMATYDGELEIYRSLDETRRSDPHKKPGLLAYADRPEWLSKDHCMPRLSWLFFTDSNLPSQMSGATNFMELESSEPRSRKRKDVCYSDNLTDIQFMKRIEREQDEEEASKKLKKRPRSEVHSTLLKCLEELVKKGDTQLFREKPSKQKYPEYYIEIKHPISLKEIIAKIKNESYQFFEEIELDFSLMSHNARLFNGPGEVFNQAESMRKQFYQSVKSKFPWITLTCPPLPDDSNLVRHNFKLKLADLLEPTKRPKV